jgi:hypothetical protein
VLCRRRPQGGRRKEGGREGGGEGGREGGREEKEEDELLKYDPAAECAEYVGREGDKARQSMGRKGNSRGDRRGGGGSEGGREGGTIAGA